LEKIAEHEAKLAGHPIEVEQASALPPKVIEVYTKSVKTKISLMSYPQMETHGLTRTPVFCRVGLLLSRYKSGKLPKAFKIIPSLQNWEEILFITRPGQW
jgi:essential nuclear protein 1